jgi:hypothetical protein
MGSMTVRRWLLVAGISVILLAWIIGMAWLINFEQTTH